MRYKLCDTLSIAAILALGALAVYLYPDIPDPMPTHRDLNGAIDGVSTKAWGMTLSLMLPLLLFLVLKLLPLISPQGFRMEKFQNVMDILVLTITLAVSGMSAMALIAATGSGVPVGTWRALILGSTFLVVGNFLGKIRRNFFVGIRTPWTLASEEVWARTHRVGAWLFMLAGLAIVFLAGDPEKFLVVLLAAVGAAAIISVAYSFLLYWKLHGFRDV